MGAGEGLALVESEPDSPAWAGATQEAIQAARDDQYCYGSARE